MTAESDSLLTSLEDAKKFFRVVVTPYLTNSGYKRFKFKGSLNLTNQGSFYANISLSWLEFIPHIPLKNFLRMSDLGEAFQLSYLEKNLIEEARKVEEMFWAECKEKAGNNIKKMPPMKSYYLTKTSKLSSFRKLAESLFSQDLNLEKFIDAHRPIMNLSNSSDIQSSHNSNSSKVDPGSNSDIPKLALSSDSNSNIPSTSSHIYKHLTLEDIKFLEAYVKNVV